MIELGHDPSKNIAIPDLPDEISGLEEIALNLWWTWNPRGKALFELINPYLWKESGHNPIKLLKMLSANERETLSENKRFLKEYRFVYAIFKDYLDDNTAYVKEKPLPIAYFCAEYGLHHSVPIYSGGLGFLAGDILKASSDMGLPMVGIGFMYPHGYIRQVIGSDGWQNGTNETIDKDTAPIERVLDEKGGHFTIKVPYIDPPVYASVWKINVGRVTLYLLDTDIEQNDPWDRQISSRLYAPDLNQRLRQQIVLGIGGYRVLEELGIEYSILHLNEGHPAFALFERIRSLMEKDKMHFEDAVKKVKETSIFTTHTPLQAATDVYSFEMMSDYFSEYWQKLGIGKEQFFGFGINPDEPQSGFNMTVLGFMLCEHRNAVSKKHCTVSNEIWKNLFVSENKELPIDYVTNGVHLPTWQSDKLLHTLDEVFGEQWHRLEDDPAIWSHIDEISDRALWDMHYENKRTMVSFIRERVRQKWAEGQIDPIMATAEGVMLDPDVLTIGFARRMTSYKRPDLILKDLDRLEKIVNNSDRPVQIIFAGKAHPSDNPGKKLIQEIVKVSQDHRFKGRIAFVEDYGEEVGKNMVRGVDVWLNNPLIPMEACGTSGMKASLNGVLHLSCRDGWWPEGYNGKNGWQIGGEVSNDMQDANSIYDILENDIVPRYYTLNEDGLPMSWITMMREAMKSISPHFNARRMMQDYLDKFYLPVSHTMN